MPRICGAALYRSDNLNLGVGSSHGTALLGMTRLYSIWNNVRFASTPATGATRFQ